MNPSLRGTGSRPGLGNALVLRGITSDDGDVLSGIVLSTLVAVSVTTPREEPAQSPVVDSCNTALGEGSCMPQDPAEPAEGAPLTALLEYSGDSLRVELLDGRRVVAVRELSFAEADSPKQRYVAGGLLVAAMTASQLAKRARSSASATEAAAKEEEREEQQKSATDAASSSPTAIRPPRVSSAPPRPAPWTLDVGVLGSPALSWSQWRMGGLVRAGYRWSELGWLLTIQGSHSVAVDPKSGWLSVGAGPVWYGGPWRSNWSIWLGAEGVGETVWVTLRETDQQRAAWRVGGRFTAGASWPASEVAPWIALQATALAPELVVRLDGGQAKDVPVVSVGLALGARFSLGR